MLPISTKSFHTSLMQDFHLSTQDAERLRSYYVLHWEAKYLRQHLCTHVGYIEHNGVLYTPLFYLDVVHLPARTQLRLSFRETYDEERLPNYVLIKKLGT